MAYGTKIRAGVALALAALRDAKEEAIRMQEFGLAASLRELETELAEKIRKLHGLSEASLGKDPEAAHHMFGQFNEKSIKVIMLAQDEARRLGHNFVGTEQILLGLIGEGTGIAAKALKSMRVNLKDTRIEVEKIVGRGSGFVAVEIPFTPRAKRVIELAWDEACRLGNNYVATEHLLLGLLREGEGAAARVLENLGLNPEAIRIKTLELIAA